MLAPQLEKFHRDHAEISVMMISRGEPKENRAKVKEQGLTFPVVLLQTFTLTLSATVVESTTDTRKKPASATPSS